MDFVLGGKPVPDGNVERNAGRVAEVANVVGTVDGELRCVDSVGVIETEIGEVGGAGSEGVGG